MQSEESRMMFDLKILSSIIFDVPLERLRLLKSSGFGAKPLMFDVSADGGLCGGKGGFGSLLRAAGKVSKTRNKSAMRDLFGRRIRYSEQEKQLVKWMEDQKLKRAQRGEGSGESESGAHMSGAEIKEINEEFAYLKKHGRLPEKRMCHRGSQCKYRYKCRFRHPNDDDDSGVSSTVSGRKRRYSQSSSSDFDDSHSSHQHSKQHKKQRLFPGLSKAETLNAIHEGTDETRLMDAVRAGMQAKKKKEQFESVQKQKKEEEQCGSSDYASTSLNNANKEEEEKNDESQLSSPLKGLWNGIDVSKVGLATHKHHHKLIFGLRIDCDFVICDECERVYIGESWFCRDCPSKCDFDLCSDCLDLMDDVVSLDKQDSYLAEMAAKKLVDESKQKKKNPMENQNAKDTTPLSSSSLKIDSDGRIDVSAYESAQELESVGLDRLKSELRSLGLKCGGTLSERAQRLFLLKSYTLHHLPKKVFAKKKKQYNPWRIIRR